MNDSGALSHICLNFQATIQAIAGRANPASLTVGPEGICCLTGLPHPFGNVVVPASQPEDRFLALLRQLEKWTAEKSAPVAMLLFPDNCPDAWSPLATGRGWVLLDDMPGMLLDLADVSPSRPLQPGMQVTMATGREGLEFVTRVLAEGCPVPHGVADLWMRGIDLTATDTGGRYANFLATVEGEPAACASVAVEDGSAGVYCVATVERFRKRGLGEAVTRAAVQYGRSIGARHGLLHATEMGCPVYERIGFRTQVRIPVLGFGLG